MSRCYFITGTDTGAGKTRIATGLLQAAQLAGFSTLGLKPVSAGCRIQGKDRVNEDVRLLQSAATCKLTVAEINPAALLEPMAPHIAAAQEDVTLKVSDLAAHCVALAPRAEFTVIEGAGGWLVPLNAAETMADLAAAIGAPVILVVGLRLGCINHALLSAAAIAGHGLQLAGWVANCIEPDMRAREENIAAIAARLRAPLLGTVPWLHRPDPAVIAARLDLKLLRTAA